MIILGIDTALRCTGYGVVEMIGKQFRVIDCGVIRNHRKVSHSECLRCISGGIEQLVGQFKPDVASIEGGFFFKNAKTAMVLGMARGSAICMLGRADVPCYEYAPARAKKVVAGSGRAGKEQVAQVMAGMFHLNVQAIPDDSTDALSLCVCHGLTVQSLGGINLGQPI